MGQMMTEDVNGAKCLCPTCGSPCIVTLEYELDDIPTMYYEFDTSQYEMFRSHNFVDWFELENGSEVPNVCNGGSSGE